MAGDGKIVREIDIVLIARRTRFLGIAILIGVFLVFSMGLFVAASNVNKDYEILNHITFVFCVITCAFSVFLKKKMFAGINAKNYMSQYFNAHVLSFGLCDLGGLLCITTSLFINVSFIYAIAGFTVTAIAMILNFPGAEDYKKLKL
jgi:hypothetical protein